VRLSRYRAAVSQDRIREGLERLPPPLADAGLAAGVTIAISIAIAAGQEADAKDPDAFAYLLGAAIAAPLHFSAPLAANGASRLGGAVATSAIGLSNQEIAERLVISPATAKTHVSRTMMRVHAHDRAQLVVLAYETGLVRVPE
jgi:Bacterial regulatory proteins, luxR family